MFIKDEFKIGLLEQQGKKKQYLKKKKGKKTQKKSCLLKEKKISCEKWIKYSRISLCWLVTH